jgi:hypothetical protein
MIANLQVRPSMWEFGHTQSLRCYNYSSKRQKTSPVPARLLHLGCWSARAGNARAQTARVPAFALARAGNVKLIQSPLTPLYYSPTPSSGLQT